MFNLFRKRAPDRPPTTGGRLVYAVGDVHGCYDEMKAL